MALGAYLTSATDEKLKIVEIASILFNFGMSFSNECHYFALEWF